MTRAWIVDALGEVPFERLASTIKPSELWSVLMEVLRARARARTPREILAQYRRDAFVRPAAIDQRTLVEIEAHLLASAAAFDAIELSPVAPLGSCSSIAVTDQHRVLSALRGTEVVSDPTNILALECAERLAHSPTATIKLATCQRVVRAQEVPKVPGYAQHFRIFVLATAGREKKDHGLSVEAIVEHVTTMLAALDRLEAHGYAFGRRRVELYVTQERRAVGDRIASRLGEVVTSQRLLEHPYYSAGMRFMVWLTDSGGNEVPLVDGGAFDWVGRLTSNRRCAFIASGLGAQLVPFAFLPTRRDPE